MKKKIHDDPGPAKALIDMEVKAALNEISLRDFPARMQQRLPGGSQEVARVRSWRKKPALALGIFLIIAAAGGALVLTLILPSSFEKRVKSVDTFLRNAPGLQSFLSNKEQGITGPMENTEENELEWTIKHLLFSLYRKKLSEKDISEDLEEALSRFPAFIESYQSNKKES